MDLLLIPVAHALPALRAHLDALPDDGSVLTRDELQALAQFAQRVIETGERLVRYGVALAGAAQQN